jgi:ABC-2 type transport system ATP-binding protein
MKAAISIRNLNKTYASGFAALKDINLEIRQGEIFALLGPNGAGKTTLINAICGLVRTSGGVIDVCGHDVIKDYRAARNCIGLVPQELSLDIFGRVWNVVNFSRGLFGKPSNPAYIEELLKKLSLWDKKDSEIRRLSGGMKRRVMIAKALAHEPAVLFLDEPTAGVDVELRKSMWDQVRALRETGVTIILTTHYLEEAEEIADRVGVLRKGELILTEEKSALMKKMGKKELVLDLYEPLSAVPATLSAGALTLSPDGRQLIFTYDTTKEGAGIVAFLEQLKAGHIHYKDLSTRQSSLEDIFVHLVGQ